MHGVQAFRTTDEALLAQCSTRGWMDGACAVCCWVVGEVCVVANVGDAKAVLARAKVRNAALDQRSDCCKLVILGLNILIGQDELGFKAVTLTREHLALHAAER